MSLANALDLIRNAVPAPDRADNTLAGILDAAAAGGKRVTRGELEQAFLLDWKLRWSYRAARIGRDGQAA